MRTLPCRVSQPASCLRRPLRAAALTMLLVASAGADVFHVPAQIASVHWAVNIAQPGDTVLVAPGTYVENIVWPPWTGVVLLAEQGPAETILDGGGLEAVISIETAVDSTTVIRGFTIRNGHTEGT
jgi:serine protease